MRCRPRWLRIGAARFIAPFHCIYCLANQVSGTKNRYRSVENVIGEIKQCVEQFGIRNFLFRSDLFTQNKKWVVQLCQAILDHKLDIQWACNSRVDTLTAEALGWMKKAGCWIVAMGVESGDQDTLDKIEKQAKAEQAFSAVKMLREAGIKSSVYLLMGLPWDTKEKIGAQVKFAKALDPDFLEIFYSYPFPGTKLYAIAVEAGLIQDGEIPKQAYADPAMGGLYLSIEEFGKLRRRALRQYYMRPKVIARTLRNARNPKELFNYMRHGVAAFKGFLSD
jgi:anaerobic magnesium-protoporphyrin IX monomethyl ester cyclase